MAEIYRVTLVYDMPNASVPNNVFHYGNIGIATPTDAVLLDAIETWVRAEWAAAWANLAYDGVELVLFNVDEMLPTGHVLRNIGSVNIGLFGAVGSQNAPAAVAGYILAYTGLPRQRGSKYLPGMAEGVLDEGAFNAPALLQLAQCLIAYLLHITVTPSVELEPGVLSDPLAAFVGFVDLGTIESIPAYQRRRKPQVGS